MRRPPWSLVFANVNLNLMEPLQYLNTEEMYMRDDGMKLFPELEISPAELLGNLTLQNGEDAGALNHMTDGDSGAA